MKDNIIVEVIYINNGGVYFAGQIVDGHVRLRVQDSQKIGEIKLRWLGHAAVSWSEGMGDDSTSYSGKETYFDTEMVLLEKVLWEFWFLLVACLYFLEFLILSEPYQQGYSKLLPGVYSYPFSFQLPLDIPNSYLGIFGWVRYEVTVTVVKPWAFNISKSVPFTVVSHLDLNTLPYANTKGIAEDEKVLDCLCCMSGLITATITTDRLGYVPGEVITFTAEIHNKSDTDMHPCKAALSMKVRCHANGRKTEGSVILCKLRGPAIPSGTSCQWERQRLLIPPLPPSFLHGCKLIDIEYFVSITVEPAGPSFALLVPLMIVIGTIPLKTATHIIPQLEFAQSQLVKNDLSPLYPYYNFISRRGEDTQLVPHRTPIRKRAF